MTAGEWLVIRGANGCGKSTLLKTIVGLLSPHSGSLWCTEFCYLGHDNGFRPHTTVAGHLDFIARYFNVPRPATPVDHLRPLPLNHLSAGLKRQVALCQFLLSPHKLWIMDEPFEHLDTQAKAYFLKRMQAHIARGGAIVQTSHESLTFSPVKEIWLS